MLLEGKVAIVTGGGVGIGESIAKLFAREGASVCITGRQPDRLYRVVDEIKAAGGKAIAVPGDVTAEAAVALTVAETRATFGRIDILINNAGIAGPTKSILEITRSEFEETLDINLIGVFLMTQAAVPDMIEKRRGWIVNIGSITGKRPLVFRLPYTTSKMGLIGFTRTLALELGPFSINVNCVCPGRVRGERLDSLYRARDLLKGRSMGGVPLEEIGKITVSGVSPLDRLVEPEDCADLTLFLCTEQSRNMTGQDINVSAGMVMY